MPSNYKQLTYSDRRLLGKLKKAGKSIREIASILEFSPSTISREIKRNYCGFGYCCNMAHQRTQARRHRANQHRTKLGTQQIQFIKQQLLLTLSPEQIASLFPRAFGHTITPKTIYRYIHSYSGYRMGLQPLLRTRPRVRRHQWRRRSRLPDNRPMIHERPTSANKRSRYGHWEMDLFLGKAGSPGAVLTLVERKTLFSIVLRLPDRKASSVQNAISAALRPYRVKSITTDNGNEFMEYDALRRAAGAEIYYCRPYRAWEKGLVENTIGLYRHFFPKKTALPTSPEEYRKAQDLLNNRPRKSIHFHRPQNLLDKIRI